MTTVRRDIKILVDSQQVNKVYGGIAVLEHKPGALCKQRALPLSVPAPEAGEKLDIARTAATIIKDGDAIYLDSSPIIETMIPFLQARDLTVVTPPVWLIWKSSLKNGYPLLSWTGSYRTNKVRLFIRTNPLSSWKTWALMLFF